MPQYHYWKDPGVTNVICNDHDLQRVNEYEQLRLLIDEYF